MRKLSHGLAMLLCLAMLLGMLPTGILAAGGSTAALLDGITVDGKPLEGFAPDRFAYELNAADYQSVPVIDYVSNTPGGDSEESVLLVTGSDFQDPATSYTRSDYAKNGDYAAQNARLKAIMEKIKGTYGNAYGFIAGGDYNFDEIKNSSSRTAKGIENVKATVQEVYGSDINTVFVQGNHDALNSGTSATGANDTDYYGVFVMNEDDYRSYPLTSSKWSDWQQSEAKAQALADKLDSYLKEKVDAGYQKPVFITSHVPLHFSTRTKDKADAIYADLFYDVITKYGEDLNIFFLFGHNHAWGDDDYLGGASVFLTRGDSINIAKHGSDSTFSAKPLNFTYMNFGYTGYYWSKWASSSSDVRYSDADSTLAMSAFVITGNTVTVSRWSEEGMCPLKTVGAASQGNRGVPEVCEVTTNEYASPQTIKPMKESDPTGGLNVSVQQFSGIPGVAVLTAVEPTTGATAVYRIGIGNPPVATDLAQGWEAAAAKGWQVSGRNAKASFGERGLRITGEAGMANNLFYQPAFGNWSMQTNLSLAEALSASGQQAGLLVRDDDENYIKLVYERSATGYYVTAYAVSTQIARSENLGALTELSLRITKRGSAYTFAYCVDASTWCELSGSAKLDMAEPKLGVFCGAVAGATATFDAICAPGPSDADVKAVAEAVEQAKAAQKAAEEASAAAEAAAKAGATDQTAAEAAKLAAKEAQSKAEAAQEQAIAAQKAAEAANADAVQKAAAAAAASAEAAQSAANAAKAQSAAAEAQAKAEAAQKAAAAAQAKAEDASAKGEAASAEAAAAQKAAEAAKAAAQEAVDAAKLAANAAAQSNVAAAEAAAKAAADSAKVAEAERTVAAAQVEIAEAVQKAAQEAANAIVAQQAAEAARAAAELAQAEAAATNLRAAKHMAQSQIALAVATADLAKLDQKTINEIVASMKKAYAEIDAAETKQAIDAVCEAFTDALRDIAVPCPSSQFLDVPAKDNWAHAGIDYCVANQLMEGISATKFAPEATLTRAQLVTILWRIADKPMVDYAMFFEDVKPGKWYTEAIRWAAALKIVNGYSDTTFGVDDPITREQIATILYRFAGKPTVAGSLSAYPDAAKVSAYAVDAMLWATDKGIITGIKANDGITRLAPQEHATRAQIAVIIMREQEAK